MAKHVKLNYPISRPEGHFKAGRVVDFGPELNAHLVKQSEATWVEVPDPEPASAAASSDMTSPAGNDSAPITSDSGSVPPSTETTKQPESEQASHSSTEVESNDAPGGAPTSDEAETADATEGSDSSAEPEPAAAAARPAAPVRRPGLPNRRG
ncbi:MAG: hypothetical protein ACJ8C4_05735 [Gemmataceae bacterium]